MNIAQVTVQVRMHVRSCLKALLLMSLLLGLSAASAESPEPKKPRGYLPVEDVPKRQDPSMSPDDRAKLVKDLDRKSTRLNSSHS